MARVMRIWIAILLSSGVAGCGLRSEEHFCGDVYSTSRYYNASEWEIYASDPSAWLTNRVTQEIIYMDISEVNWCYK